MSPTDQPVGSKRAARVACAALVLLEVVGTLMMFAPIPLAWMWVGARVYDVTGSLAVDLAVVLAGFIGSTMLVMSALNRLDAVYIALRRRAGDEKAQGALTQVVVVSTTVGGVGFWVWFHIIEKAFVIPFMPTQ